MSSQSLMTPAMFMVSALERPISRNTDMLSAAGREADSEAVRHAIEEDKGEQGRSVRHGAAGR